MADNKVPWDRQKNIKSMEAESPYHPEMDFNQKIKGFLGMGDPETSPAASPSPSLKKQVVKKIYDSGK